MKKLTNLIISTLKKESKREISKQKLRIFEKRKELNKIGTSVMEDAESTFFKR